MLLKRNYLKHPTKHDAILEPQNMSIDQFDAVQKHRSADFEAQIIGKSSAGPKDFHPMLYYITKQQLFYYHGFYDQENPK